MNAYEKMTLFPNVVNVVVWLKYKIREKHSIVQNSYCTCIRMEMP